LRNLANITNSTTGVGNAEKISIEVDDSVSLSNGSVFSSNVDPGGEGGAGEIVVRSRTLSLTDGSQIAAAVARQPIDARGNPITNIAGVTGNGGSIEINATDSIDISRFSSVKLPVSVPDPFDSSKPVRTEGFSSGLLAETERGAVGDAGTITVTTGELRIADGGIITAFTDNPGNAGNITINARTLEATNGGQIVTSTRNRESDEKTGNAGNIILKIADSIKLSGSDPNFEARQKLFDNEVEKNDVIGNQGANSGIFANTSEGLTGDGGDIKIDPPTVVIEDGSAIAVNSQGTGRGGDLELQANNLSLDRGSITAETNSGQGGDIKLTVSDIMLLRNNSDITATAGTGGGGGDGGNIDIDAGFVVAAAGEDNDITANAFTGDGGQIDINSQVILGFQKRDAVIDTPLSDLAASSQAGGLQGEIVLTTPEVDPTSGLVELQGNTVDAADLVAQNPCRIENGQVAGGSTLVITGKGGLPPNPNETLTPIEGMVDWLKRPNPQPTEAKDSQSSEPQRKPVVLGEANKAEIPIQQAQGMVKKPDGRVVLTANASSVTPQNPPLQPTTCKVK
jgi:large exoprotein involved in heme utilization and adhesion